MKIVVCVKIDTGASADKDDAFLRANRALSSVLPPFDAHAVEEALRLREQGKATEIAVVALSPAEHLGGVRDALAMGADRAVLFADPAMNGSDLLATSRVLAALLRREAADLYLYCPWSGDIDGSLLWAMTAERLGLPVLGQVRSLAVENGSITGERQADQGDYVQQAALPACVELSETVNKPRYVSMKGKQAARSKPLDLLTLAALEIPPESVGDHGAATRLTGISPTQSTRQRIIIDGDGDAPRKLVDFLIERELIA